MKRTQSRVRLHEMTASEFRQAQAATGWNGTKLAAELGLRPDTVSRLRCSDRPIIGPVVLAMRALGSGWRP